MTYPANIRVEKSPPYTIFAYVLHSATSVEEDGQHSFTQLDDSRILFCFGWLSGIVCHAVFFRDRWDNEGRVQAHEGPAERGEF
jgi:hypothetical protein